MGSVRVWSWDRSDVSSHSLPRCLSSLFVPSFFPLWDRCARLNPSLIPLLVSLPLLPSLPPQHHPPPVLLLNPLPLLLSSRPTHVPTNPHIAAALDLALGPSSRLTIPHPRHICIPESLSLLKTLTSFYFVLRLRSLDVPPHPPFPSFSPLSSPCSGLWFSFLDSS